MAASCATSLSVRSAKRSRVMAGKRSWNWRM